MAERVTIFDIAKEAGVSIATVSRVMAGASNVRPATREKVIDVANKYNFRPSMLASNLSRKVSRTLGILVPLEDNPYYTELSLAAQREAQAAGYSAILYQLPTGGLLNDSFMDLLIARRLDGLLVCGDILSELNEHSFEASLQQLRQHMAVVMITSDRPYEHCVCLCNGLDIATRMSMNHLFQLGHERIAMLGGTGPATNPRTREYTYFSEMTTRGLEPYPYTSGNSLQEGELCVLKLWGSLGERQPPTAMICFNDLIALGALKQCKKLGLRVPEEMALIGCDNQFFADYADPPLTTVDLRIQETARLAVRTLIGPDELPAFHQVMQPNLVIRESCGAHLPHIP